MAEQNPRPREAPASVATASFLEAAWTLAHARLYLDNPFRVLGLPTLAAGRDITKRGDQLRLSAELGTESYDWSFAPATPPRGEQLRAASQLLKEPRQRLLAEFFWFWPNSYPTESEDEALGHLARGESSEAVAKWAALPTEEHPVALHNLAVYHHLMAIEQEQLQPPLAEEDIAAWWRAALRYWQVVVENDEIWNRLSQRVAMLNDAQLAPEIVEPFRRQLLDLVSSVNSAIALRFAEAGDHRSAGRHVAMLGEIHADAAEVRRVLERGVAPILRRIDLRVAECQRAVSGDAKSGLAAAKFLIEHCEPDIQVLNTLCGREAEFFAEACSRLCATTLDAIVAYQHATSDNAPCLPLLIYLQTLPLTADARKRSKATFEVIFANATNHQEEKHEGSELDEGREPLYARSYRVVAEKVIPGVEALDLRDTARRECCDKVADLLRRVAKGACDERDDINFALHAYQTLFALPCDDAERTRREAERDQFHQQFLLRMQKELRLSLPDHVLEITVRGLRWDDQTVAFDDVTGIRYGRTTEGGQVGFVVAWRTAQDETKLDSTNAFVEPGADAAHYARIVDALHFFVGPGLVNRLVAQVRAGQTIEVGTTPFSPEGVTFSGGTRFWKKEEPVPYSQVKHRIETGDLVILNVKNPRIQLRYPILDTWNAAVMGYVIAALA